MITMRFWSAYFTVSLLLVMVPSCISWHDKLRKKEEANYDFQSSFKEFASEPKARFSPVMPEREGLFSIQESFRQNLVHSDSIVKDEETQLHGTPELRKMDNTISPLDFLGNNLLHRGRVKRNIASQERRNHNFRNLNATEDNSATAGWNKITQRPEVEVHGNPEVSVTQRGRAGVTLLFNASVHEDVNETLSGNNYPKTSRHCSELQDEPSGYGDICLDNQSHWSCVGNCGRFYSSPCSCDPNCLLYNTCCQDFIDTCPDLAESSDQIIREFPTIHAECDSSKGVMLISNCPADSTPEDRIQCTESSTSFGDLFPVMDPTYFWNFKNVHCWKCWNMGRVSLPWTVKITLDEKTKGDVEEYNLATYKRFILNETSIITWSPPDPVYKVPCLRNAVTKCAACGENESERDCPGFVSYVQIDDVVYKNYACYTCSRAFRGDDKVNCETPDMKYFQFHDFQFDLTLNFKGKYGDGNVEIAQEKVTRGSFRWNRLRCSPSTELCSAVRCSRNYLLQNDKCEREERYIHIGTRFCIPNINRYPLTCQDTTMPLLELFSIESSVIRGWFKEMIESAMLLTDAHEVMSVLDPNVHDTADNGLVIFVDIKVSPEYTSISKTFSEFSQDLQRHVNSFLLNNLQELGFFGPVLVCPFISLGRAPREFKKRRMTNCGFSIACPHLRCNVTKADTTSSVAYPATGMIHLCVPAVLTFYEMFPY